MEKKVSMRDKFIKYAETICSDKSILSVLKSLRKICAQNELYHEEGACVEKIWHITHDPKLYEQVGDIFLQKVRNRDIANAAYNKFIHLTNPDFYYKYTANLKALGFNCADIENLDEDLSDEIIDLCDRFDVIVYMMICLHKNKDFDGVIELVKFLSDIKSKIFEYRDKDCGSDKSYIDDIECTEKHLSEVLSQTQNRNDINEFAIDLDNENKKAYFNIIKDLITYKHEQDALGYYNDVVCTKLGYSRTNDIKNLCWIVSDFYRDIYEFYNAVFMQKIVLEMELQEENINA